MKTKEEVFDEGVAYVERIHEKQVEGTFCKHQLAYAYQEGHINGYNEGIADSHGENELVGWLKDYGELKKLCKKASLHPAAEIDFNWHRATLTIYNLDDEGKVHNRVFEANNNIHGNTMNKMGLYIQQAKAFVLGYAEDNAVRLEEKEKALTAELKATKKKLAGMKKVKGE